MEMERTNLSHWLARQMEDRGWSARELARRAGVSHTTVNRVVNNLAPASADFCVGIARALGESPEDVLRLAGQLPLLPPEVAEEQEATQILRKLTTGDRNAVMRMLRGLSRTPPPTAKDKLLSIKDDDDLTDILVECWPAIPHETKLEIVELLRQAVREQSNTEKQETST